MNEIKDFKDFKDILIKHSQYPHYQNIMSELNNYSFQMIEDKLLICNDKNTFTIKQNNDRYDVDIKTPHATKSCVANGNLDDVISILYLELLKERKYYNDLLIS
jgi:hypothetical protein